MFRSLLSLIPLIALIPLTLGLPSCSSPVIHRDPPAKEEATLEPKLQESSIEISYELGHSRRKLLLQTHEQMVYGRNTLNKQLLHEGDVDPGNYVQFLQKASDYVSQVSRRPAQESPDCTNSYTMTVKIGNESRTVRGCRQDEQGFLIKLIREGEFLLFSRK